MNKYLILLLFTFCVGLGNAQSVEFYNLYLDANSLLIKGQFDKAIDLYNKALKTGQHDYVYFNRGNAYFGKKDYSNALNDYNKAIQLNKNYTEAYCQRGLVKSFTADPGCCDDLKKAIKLDSPDAKEAYQKYCKKKSENSTK